ncbi:MAG: hypothetical protein QXU88_02830, partial [Candidatus Woesearchaeota archaeon]
TPEYNVFQKEIEQKKLKSFEEVKAYVEQELTKTAERIKVLQKGQREGTMTRALRRLTSRLDFLNLVKKKILIYL